MQSYSTRTSPQVANRVVEAARSILNKYLPDVYIYTDHYKGADSGRCGGGGGGGGVGSCDDCVRALRYTDRRRTACCVYAWLARSPGYGLTLVAESTTDVQLGVERMAEAGDTAEDLGKRVAQQLLNEVSRVRWLAREDGRRRSELRGGRARDEGDGEEGEGEDARAGPTDRY